MKKLKGEWKKDSTLGMHLTAKYSGAREPKFANVDLILPVVVVGKREEAARTVLENGEWKVDRDSGTPSTPQFDVLQWWEGMAVRLPTMYRIARSILAIPHTSCDVERSFSVWKRVRSDKQQGMA